MSSGDIISIIGLAVVVGGILISAGILVGELRGLAESVTKLSGSVDRLDEKLDKKIDAHSERIARLEAAGGVRP